jgi:hypothetical protein
LSVLSVLSHGSILILLLVYCHVRLPQTATRFGTGLVGPKSRLSQIIQSALAEDRGALPGLPSPDQDKHSLINQLALLMSWRTTLERGGAAQSVKLFTQ